jgi:bacterioferritin
MNSSVLTEHEKISREEMVELLNEDLAREYQAIIAYVVYSQTMKGAAYTDIGRELEQHATEELAHALILARQIDYFGGMPEVSPKPVKTSNDPKKMLQFDLDNERETLVNYRQRIRQADAMGEFALSEVLREIVVQEQEHLQDLSDALGIRAPEIE